VRMQCVDDFAASVDQKVLARLLLQPGNFLDEIPLEQRAVPRQRLLEGLRGNVLREGVHPNGELALGVFHRGPGGGETLERHAPEQQRVAREQLVALLLRELVVEMLARPAAVLDLANAAGIGHDAVDGHVLRCNDLSHLILQLTPRDVRAEERRPRPGAAAASRASAAGTSSSVPACSSWPGAAPSG